MDPERITRGVISLTTGDSRRGSLGSIFRFLGLCVCLGVQRGLSTALIKYSGNVRLQIDEPHSDKAKGSVIRQPRDDTDKPPALDAAHPKLSNTG